MNAHWQYLKEAGKEYRRADDKGRSWMRRRSERGCAAKYLILGQGTTESTQAERRVWRGVTARQRADSESDLLEQLLCLRYCILARQCAHNQPWNWFVSDSQQKDPAALVGDSEAILG